MSRRVGLFIPCYVDQFFPRIGRATVQVLERLGVQCDYDPAQTCCGQPAYNSGYHHDASRVAEHFVRVFDKYEVIVAPGGSCVSMVRHHFRDVLGRDEPVTQRVHELCEYLTEQLGEFDLNAQFTHRAALHMPCHMLRELDGDGPVRKIVSRIEGLDIVELPCDEWCCGFGGTFGAKFPELSAAIGKRKLDQMLKAQCEYLLSPEASCLIQLAGLIEREGYLIQPLHIVEVLAGEL